MTEKRFDFEDEYITLDGGVFATAKNRQDAELISRTLNQSRDESEELKHQLNYLKDRLDELIVVKNENNDLKKENEEIKLQYNNLKVQRDEFYRGARENANRVGQLKKENKELKADNNRMVKFIMSTGYTLKDYLNWLKEDVWK